MMSHGAARKELIEVVNEMGDFTMTASEYIDSVENLRRPAKVGGRGRGIVRPVTQESLEEVRFAAQINRLLPKAVPIGQLATTEDTLARDFDTEITAGLRAMGISGADGALRSDRTRRTMLDGEDIHVDGNFPVILNRDLFQQRYQEGAEEEKTTVPVQKIEPYDPELPLALQFSTITEILQCPKKLEPKTKKEPTNERSKRTHPNPKPTAAGKRKKPKWRKVPYEELVNESESRGRYEAEGPIGPGAPAARFFRDVVGDEGVKYIL